jgi:hypothetical protein
VLKAGRPPVCHEFLCNTIVDEQATYLHKSVIKALSQLMTYIGKNALGGQHLVEVMIEDRFYDINLSRMQHRLMDAKLAFKQIQEFYADRRLNSKAFVHLEKIQSLGR